MIVAHTADLHVQEGPRLADQIRTLESIEEAVQGCDLFIVAGDLYGRTVPHRSSPAERNAVADWLRACAESCPVIVVAGNHDAPGDAEILEQLRTRFPIIVAPAAGGIVQAYDADGVTVWAVPYPRRSSIAEYLRANDRPAEHSTITAAGSALLDSALLCLADEIRDREGPQIVAGHLATVGAKVAGGERLAGREVEASTAALRELTAAGAAYVALGHIHLRQEAAPGCWYPGSPHRVDFGEVEAEKTINAFEIDDRTGALLGDVFAHKIWARRFVTVDAAWGEDGWTYSAEPAAVKGAEVRLRLQIPDEAQTIADRPQVEAALADLGAERVISEILIDRDARVRASDVAEARRDAAKVEAFWQSLVELPPEGNRARALALLEALEHGEKLAPEVESEIADVLGEGREVAA